jgi:hypothetical protein
MPVHSGHFNVQRQDVRVELLDLLSRRVWIGRRADDLDGGIRAQEFVQHLANQSRVVDDQDTRSCHRVPSRGDPTEGITPPRDRR